MARKLVFVPSAAPSGVPQLKMEDIPQDVRDECEEVYAALKANPAGRIHATFDTPDELNQFVTQVNSYCALRMVDGKPAPIRFRRSPTKNMPKNEMDFKITDLVTKSEQETQDIRDGVDAVKAAAAKPAAPAKAAKAAAK